MAVRPSVSASAERTYGRLSAFQEGDPENGWGLLSLTEALAVTRRKPEEALRHDDVGSGQRRMLSPSRAPAWALPALAARAGVQVLDADEQTLRRRIATRPRARRCTEPAMREAVAETLLSRDPARVRLLERHDPSQPGVDAPDHLTVVVRSGDAPDMPATFRAALTQKPWGVLLHLVTTQGLTWDELTGYRWDDLPTWDDVQNGFTIDP